LPFSPRALTQISGPIPAGSPMVRASGAVMRGHLQ
jgi:hypothetical protein